MKRTFIYAVVLCWLVTIVALAHSYACEQCVWVGGFWQYQCEGGFQDGGYYCVQGQPGRQCQIYYTDCYDPNYCDPECPASYKPSQPEKKRHEDWLITQQLGFLTRIKNGDYSGSTIYLDKHCPVATALTRRMGTRFELNRTTVVIQ